MMGKASLGGGRPSAPSSFSSASHLSATAPPFTIDRSNSKPFSTQTLQFPDIPYDGGFGHPWNFPALPLQSDNYQASDIVVDSHWSTSNLNAKSSSHSGLYKSEAEHYCNTYVSLAADNGTPSVAVSSSSYDLSSTKGFSSVDVSSIVDYTQGFWGSSPQQYELVDAKPDKLSEHVTTYHHQKTTPHGSLDYMKQGSSSFECGDTLGKHYFTSCGQYSDSFGRESCNGLVLCEHTDNASLLNKDRFFPVDSSKGTLLRSELSSPTSVSLDPVPLSPVGSTNYRCQSDPYEKWIQKLNSCVSAPVSVVNPSASAVIKPSPIGSGLRVQKTISGNFGDTIDVTSVHQNEVTAKSNILNEKEPRIIFYPRDEECSFVASQAKSNEVEKEENFSVFSSIVEEPFSAPWAKDTPNDVVSFKFSNSEAKKNASNGYSLVSESARAILPPEKFSDCLEHNIAVDSPCWRGAPAFHLSPFNIVEAETMSQTKQKTMPSHLNRENGQMFTPLADPVISTFEKTDDRQAHHGLAFSAVEESDAQAKLETPIMINSGVQCSEYSIKPGEEPKLSNIPMTQRGVEENLIPAKSNLQPELLDPVMNHGNTKDGGSVAVHVAEDVLSSQSLEESEVAQFKGKSAPILDAQMLINSMKNISELLLCYWCSGSWALEEQNLEAIEDVISNLHALATKKPVHLTRYSAPILPQLDHSDKVGESFGSHMNIGGKTQIVHNASVTAQRQLDCQPSYKKMINYNGCAEKTQSCQNVSQIRDDLDTFGDCCIAQNTARSSQVVHNASVKERRQVDFHPCYEEMQSCDDCGEKAQRFKHTFQSRDDMDMSSDDRMTHSIRKVLDDNFNCGEETQPRALLFKNLWLEAEAKLCSINYKARFDRVKMEMERFASYQMKEDAAPLEKDSSYKNPRDLCMSDVSTTNAENGSLQEMVIQSPVTNANDVEASVMARLQILRSRGSPEDGKSVGQDSDPAADVCTDDSANHASENERHRCELSSGYNDKTSSVMARLQILKGRGLPEDRKSVGQHSDPAADEWRDDSANYASGNERRIQTFTWI